MSSVANLIQEFKNDKEGILEEVTRVKALFSTKKSSVTKASKHITDLKNAITSGASDVISDPHEGNTAQVARYISKLDKSYAEFDQVYERINFLYQTLKQFSQEASENGLQTLDDEYEHYNSTYEAAHVAITKIKSDQNKAKPKENTQPSQSGTTERRWSPSDVFKPSTLRLSDSPEALDTWVSRLESYLQGHENQPHNNIFNLLDDLIDDPIKAAVGFNRTDKMPIFGTDGNSLVEKIRVRWDEEYPVNRLRLAFFEKKSGQNETWDAWEARFDAEFAKADFKSLTIVDMGNLLKIMNYIGPYHKDIKEDFSNATLSGDKNKIDIKEARRIFHNKHFYSKLCDNNSVKQVRNQGGKFNNNNKNQTQNNGKGSNPKGHAVYSKDQTRPGEKPSHSFRYEDTQTFKNLAAQGKCFRCASPKCSNSNNKGKCQHITSISCNYCKKQQRPGKGHVEAACIRKERDAQRHLSSVKHIFNEAGDEEEPVTQ